MAITYQEAGVDIDAGTALIERIKPLAAKTQTPLSIGTLGGFGGLIQLPIDRYRQPLLVTTTDGIGTKIEIANTLKKYDTIKPLYIDILHTLSSKNNAGIMDFPIFADQLYKFNYRTLFFEEAIDEKFRSSSIEQYRNNIKHLIKLFNATHDVDYYIEEIYKYNVANIELKNQLEHELFLALNKLKKDNK